MSVELYHSWRHRFALLTALATFLLLGAGGLVTSHGAGMAVPDWPNSYGYNMFFFPVSLWVGGVFYEHTHRLMASGVGFLTCVLALWLFGRNARRFMRWTGLTLMVASAVLLFALAGHRSDALVLNATGLLLLVAGLVWPRCEPAEPWLRRLGLAAFGAVVLQGVLGGLRVILFRDAIGIFHAALAQLFFVLICAIALFTSRWWIEREGRRVASASGARLPGRTLLLATTCLILVQLVIGAAMRHQHAGLSIPDFPLAYGKLWPATDADSIIRYNQQRVEVAAANPITAFQVELQMVHRVLAGLILIGVGLSVWVCRRFGRGEPESGAVQRVAYGWLALLVTQALLGASTVWTNKAADVATLHVMVGALSLGVGTLLTLLAFRRTEPVDLTRASRPSAAMEPTFDAAAAARPS